MKTPADPQLRASGELLHQIKTGGLSPNEAASYARMLRRADKYGILDPDSYSDDNIERIIDLMFAVKLPDGSLLLNPHVAQIGDKTKRGELRKRFKQALANRGN
jgi:hypothetical protein